MPDAPTGFVSIGDAAKRLATTRSNIYRLRDLGYLDDTWIGFNAYVSASDVEALAKMGKPERGWISLPNTNEPPPLLRPPPDPPEPTGDSEADDLLYAAWMLGIGGIAYPTEASFRRCPDPRRRPSRRRSSPTPPPAE